MIARIFSPRYCALLWAMIGMLTVGLPVLASGEMELVPALMNGERGHGEPRCWIFTHMPKSGGSTVRDLLREKWGKTKCTKYGNPEWKYGSKKAHRIMAAPYRIIAGSHAEALRRYGGERCRWFTMFRHPIPRVVSAYFYCKTAPIDPLCATSILRADKEDLHTFVRHWGNFGLRLFMLSMISPDDVMEDAKSAGRPIGASGWYLQRLYMESKNTRNDGPDGSLADYLESAKLVLETKHAAVGLLEDFNTTMYLYDRALGMPSPGWVWWSKKIGRRNVDRKYKLQEMAALEKAWTDPEIQKLVQLDIELYEHAVKVHRLQLGEYGLV